MMSTLIAYHYICTYAYTNVIIDSNEGLFEVVIV